VEGYARYILFFRFRTVAVSGYTVQHIIPYNLDVSWDWLIIELVRVAKRTGLSLTELGSLEWHLLEAVIKESNTWKE
jgi:hypothetical protein